MNLNQVTIAVKDVARAVAFYELLGLKLIVRSPHYARFESGNGASFSVHVTPDAQPSQTVVYFECADLDAQAARLVQHGVPFESMPQDMPWLWREARLRDPEGNPVCLYWAGENRLHPPWRIKDAATSA
jgi:catechol 2,3-dioxygenase-like lactoylglutathione lyase family enzyme